MNDAATLPASLRARTSAGQPVEVRLVNQRDDSRWLAVLFGSGDWRIPTEFRDPPPRVGEGEILVIGESFHAQVEEVSSKSARLVTLRLNRTGPAIVVCALRVREADSVFAPENGPCFMVVPNGLRDASVGRGNAIGR